VCVWECVCVCVCLRVHKKKKRVFNGALSKRAHHVGRGKKKGVG
jgi:hypothetical protein